MKGVILSTLVLAAATAATSSLAMKIDDHHHANNGGNGSGDNVVVGDGTVICPSYIPSFAGILYFEGNTDRPELAQKWTISPTTLVSNPPTGCGHCAVKGYISHYSNEGCGCDKVLGEGTMTTGYPVAANGYCTFKYSKLREVGGFTDDVTVHVRCAPSADTLKMDYDYTSNRDAGSTIVYTTLKGGFQGVCPPAPNATKAVPPPPQLRN